MPSSLRVAALRHRSPHRSGAQVAQAPTIRDVRTSLGGASTLNPWVRTLVRDTRRQGLRDPVTDAPRLHPPPYAIVVEDAENHVARRVERRVPGRQVEGRRCQGRNGQGHAQARHRACSLPGDIPSARTSKGPAYPPATDPAVSATGGTGALRTTSTDARAWWATRSATLPSDSRPPMPRAPTTRSSPGAAISAST